MGKDMRYLDACEDCLWCLRLWKQTHPDKVFEANFTCRSWRHPGECCQWKGAQDFARVRDAIRSRSDWVYLVFTFDPSTIESPFAAFVRGVILWSAFRKRFKRKWGAYAYVQTWEVHASGWPHVNVCIANPEFHRVACGNWRLLRRRWFRPAAMACGFGKVCWLKPYHSADGLAGYITKLARELVGAKTKNQVPVSAPRHFRRLRASYGLLPPPIKNPDISGFLAQCPVGSFARHQSDTSQKIHS